MNAAEFQRVRGRLGRFAGAAGKVPGAAWAAARHTKKG
jgi:hypothetical protein